MLAYERTPILFLGITTFPRTILLPVSLDAEQPRSGRAYFCHEHSHAFEIGISQHQSALQCAGEDDEGEG